MSAECLDVFKACVATFKRLRPTLHGDRYVLDEPAVVLEPELREADKWEAYEYLSPDANLISVFFYRCVSHEPEHRVVLRGLHASATYRVETHSGQLSQVRSGAELMTDGLTCRLERTRSADVAILTRL
jgi:hypothetical protein